MRGGTIYGPGGWSSTPGGSLGFVDYLRKAFLPFLRFKSWLL